jgi:predicted nucleic acid-binding protein
MVGGPDQFAVAAFEAAHWLQKKPALMENIAAVLLNTLDRGEAAVIQLALNENVQTVCIDEITGRRMARLHGLAVTGSIGVLLRARRGGYTISMRDALQRMRNRGIWLSDRVINFALAQADTNSDIQGA